MKKAKRIMEYIRLMRLTDKFLFFYLFILLLQMTHTIFQESTSQVYASVDTMMRTTAATIFGYFISATFEKEEDPPAPEEETERMASANTDNKDLISSEKKSNVPLEKDLCRRACRIHQQTMIIAGIGVLSLTILIFLRNFSVELPQGPTPVSLMQDFIVGSIGFLIGHAKYDKT